MTTKNIYDGIGKVIRITTEYTSNPCELCNTGRYDEIDKLINHYIEEHSYRLLHLGTETKDVSDNGLYHSSVAIMGK